MTDSSSATVSQGNVDPADLGLDSPESPTWEPTTLAPGTRLDGYVVGRPIGRGGMGTVYEATQDTLGRRVAVKVMHPELAQSDVMRARFVREARATARLRHQHAVDVIDVGAAAGVSYLVMERLDGESLAQCLAREGRLPFERACALTLPVFAAIAAAHRAGIVHRDLKPQNVFLARTPEGLEWPKVLDFGVARILDDENGNVTSTGAAVGTPFYMSPEQLLASRDVGPRSDQFALAVIVYECLTGRRPFGAASPAALCNAIVRGQYPHPRTLQPDLPARVDRALRRALRPEVGERFASVTAFAQELLADAPEPLRLVWEPTFSARASIAPPPPPDLAVDPAAGTRPDHAASEALASMIRPPLVDRRRWWVAAVVALLAVGSVALAARRSSTVRPPRRVIAALPLTTPVAAVLAPVTPVAAPVAPAVVPVPPPAIAPVARAPRPRARPHGDARPPASADPATPARGTNRMPY